MLLALIAGAARDPPARPRHRHGLRRDRLQRPVLRRHLVEAADRAGGAVRRRDRDRAGRSRRRSASTCSSHYQEQRLTGVPATRRSDPRESQTYSIHQSLIAIGSGQKTGAGRDWRPRPARTSCRPADTDFVFAAVGETYGFVGGAVVLSLYALLIWRALRILTMSKNLFGTLIAGGHPRDAHVPGLRERRHDDRDHARSPASRCRC